MQRMQFYVECVVKLNVHFDEELAIEIVLKPLPSCYDQFIQTYHLNNSETTLAQLHNLLRTAESGMKGKSIAFTPARSSPLEKEWVKEERSSQEKLERKVSCEVM